MPEPTSCPRCGAPSDYLLTPEDRAGGPPSSIRVCASRVCGVGFTDPPPEDVAAAPALSQGLEVEDLLAARMVGSAMGHLVRVLPRGALVVDAGAGSGLRARVLAERGMKVIAVEPDAVEEMRAHAAMASLPPGSVEVVRAGAEDLPEVMDGRVADAAVMWHVLEHLPDMDASLRSVGAVLRPGGLLSVAVPNRASAEARTFGPRWHGWEPSRHRWHMDADSLRIVLGAAGMAVRHVGSRGGWGYPAGIAYSVAPGADPQVNARRGRLGRALAAVMIPVAAAARAAGRGGQLVAVASRS